ncbi:alkaline phosphatase family protein [Marinicella litoralis]|uniref:Phospholipase C n=1 Tax=Marinicella litoralis TaxID=644220 RepID=A0A4R6XQ29_9GAMM|nr:alkaline phosphatase family protein [Marinicella litoralis]TDR20509.1 phospholipase C [Marinicella litoralis]
MQKVSADKKGLATFDHVVVLMLENRSFDNLLGYLYTDEEVPAGKKFAGLNQFDGALPVPSWVKDFTQHPSIKPFKATNYHQPFPDPGEVYQHVNSQIYNYINPDNCRVSAANMVAPYNMPSSVPNPPPMDGFIKDYVNTLNALNSKKGKHYNDPGYDMYSAIMQCFKPCQVNVLSTLAKEFAVFDHWFCSVPSQTWCNRSFWHAGTSAGKVVNPLDSGGAWRDVKAMASWAKNVWKQKTLFDRMKANKISHAVYIEDSFSLTELVNNFKHKNVIRAGDKLTAFKNDLKTGQLPQYAFIEPKFLGQHNDQHPSSVDVGLIDDDGPTREGSVLLGEKLIWDVYTSLMSSQYKDNTLLIITYDEHGGCFDHIAPPQLPTALSQAPGQKGFRFDRLGIRVPMVMVSAYLPENTIINDPYEHCSFIKTMCEKWDLEGLTDRDKQAPSFGSVFSDTKRTNFPVIDEPCIPQTSDKDYADDPLNDLQKSILVGAHYISQMNQKSPFNPNLLDDIETVGQAIEHLQSLKQNLSEPLGT